ncbi:hypothetical protein VOLCADRAFT_95955 [Volvox carteri f. nagariensis]|uniref:Bifunctional inhibitor/plant lipid transfer protein/seed storage helical domain-containing protein n=1 Tax=Volvox carteri f. nagariensis TaxID=3068 RepID=D8U8U1_VOLCA|nr:uncharacterized protein VOLCADRAFT_95955 [Volvox carteri f. nagariensis]EFJ43807.1 hypothetical protein VOLCADRAFT_95955 [Volvox carteri f. nagariensis]|eukprot:XP_002955053.1 hypothetical protein VOLCADRAFT_95955 [Volvox carteri f. nagariensis]
MNRRCAVLAGVTAVLLIVALGAPPVLAADKALCEEARRVLPNDPNAKAFKSCATPTKISDACCQKLTGFGKYYDCLTDPSYKADIDSYLNGVTTVDKTKQMCGF